jgi:hypothetical protein
MLVSVDLLVELAMSLSVFGRLPTVFNVHGFLSSVFESLDPLVVG